MSKTGGFTPGIEKLRGKENYHDWCFAMEAYLRHEELWDTIEAPPGKSLCTDAKKVERAWTKISLFIDPTTYVHVKEANREAKTAWDMLKDAYAHEGLSMKVSLLRKLCSIRLKDFDSIEKYVNMVISTSHKLRSLNLALPDELVAAFLLSGLPDEYLPMIMTIENGEKAITSDSVKSKLLQEVKWGEQMSSSEIEAPSFYVFNRRGRNFRGSNRGNRSRANFRGNYRGARGARNTRNVRCYKCHKFGHFERECDQYRQTTGNMCDTRTEDRNSSLLEDYNSICNNRTSQYDEVNVSFAHLCFVSMYIKESGEDEPWVIDSGASRHMCNNEKMFQNIGHSTTKYITVANKNKLSVLGEGPVCIKTNKNNVITRLNFMNALCVPNLSINLLSVSCLNKDGFDVNFNHRDKTCYIVNSNNKVLATGNLMPNGIYVLNTKDKNSAYSANNNNNSSNDIYSAPAAVALLTQDLDLWHRRLGHLNFQYMKILRGKSFGVNFSDKQFHPCETCIRGKQTEQPYRPSNSRASKPGELIHTDLCQIRESSVKGYKYFLTFMDDFSRYLFIYFLKNKHQVTDTFINFRNLIENRYEVKIKIVRSDQGREYVNKRLLDYMVKKGIECQYSVAYCPQQNFRSERINRSVIDMARTMLIEADLPAKFWAEAVATAAHILNRTPKNVIKGLTPFELWNNKAPDLNYFRVFGSKSLVHVKNRNGMKFAARSKDAIFMVYSSNMKAYKFYLVDDKEFVIRRNAKFFENAVQEKPAIKKGINKRDAENTTENVIRNEQNIDHIFSNVYELSDNLDKENEGAGDVQNEEEINVLKNERPMEKKKKKKNKNGRNSTKDKRSDYDTEGENDVSQVELSNDKSKNEDINSTNCDDTDIELEERSENVIRRSTRPKSLPERFKDYITCYVEEILDTYYIEDNVCYASKAEYKEPETYEEAINCEEADEWISSMQDEHNSLIKNGTYELCNRPRNRNIVSCKWVYKRKILPNGKIKYKSRNVARGFNQIQGIDYKSTYSPVVRYTTLRLLLALAVREDYDIVHMDVECAYLQGDLEEEVYMEQPRGFEVKGHEDKVCKLKKAIYGLKQGGLAWNKKINQRLLEIHFKRSTFDPCVYYYDYQGITVYVAVFVDDLICMSNSSGHLKLLFEKLAEKFPIKDLGELKKCFGINVTRDRKMGTLSLDQTDYIEASLRRFQMQEDFYVTFTPIDPETAKDQGDDEALKTPEELQRLQNIPYQRAIGTLMYLLQGTRPDLAYTISTLSKFNTNFNFSHWEAVKKVFRYLQGTKHLKLTFHRNKEVDLIGYSDASWGSDPDGKSITGYIFKMQNAAISWRCQRQATTALSSCDAEFQALTATIQEAVWLRGFLSELLPTFKKPIHIMCDNTSTIDFSTNQGYSHRTKHIIIKRSYAKESIELGQIILNFCPSREMLADALTKALAKVKLRKFIDEMGLK